MHHHYHDHHHHHHQGASVNRAFIIGILLNVLFVLIEAVIGLKINSLSLLTDAGHNLGDVASLALVVIAVYFAKKQPNQRFTYGYGKTTILVALANAVFLFVMVGAIGWEALQRINKPLPVQGQTVAWVAFAGIVINGITALLFLRDRKKDLNAQGAYLHMATDALVSFGVFVSGIVIFYTHWFWIDSLLSLVVMVVVVLGSWQLLKDSLRLSLDGVPSEINTEGIKKYLLNLNGVIGLHDLHIWAMSTNANALTVHLVIPNGMDDASLLRINSELHAQFQIDHTTIQVEKLSGAECEQRC